MKNVINAATMAANLFHPAAAMPVEDWKVSQVLVTPELAREWLKHNTRNRKLRRALVRRYALIMQSGNWMLTPEGIIFDSNGDLIQGQHRLNAVAESETPAWMIVWTNVNPDVFKALDRGAPRSYADALQLPKKLAECARYAASICVGRANTTDEEVKYMADFIGDTHDELMAYCGAQATLFATVPFRLAATIRILCGDGEYAKSVYRNLVLGHVSDLPVIGQWAIGQAMRGALQSAGGVHTENNFCTAWRLFDPANSDLKFLRPTNEKTLAEVRALICAKEGSA